MLRESFQRYGWRRMLLAVNLMAGLSALAFAADNRPNIIVILTDDMGYSDLGCYGGEIGTPNLDKLASEGVRFTQFYNTARCCPSRAALLTGNYSHQAGVGHMLRQTGYPGYSDHLSTDTVTMAEVLGPSGYGTYAVGKWHVARSINKSGPKDYWPMQRGFQKYYGIITGASSFYDPSTLCRGNDFITVENDPEYKPEKYYLTDAITDNSIKFISEHGKESPDKPFFMYIAYTAAHWPLHAPDDEIAKQKGKYDQGYEPIRKARFEKMKELGLISKETSYTATVGDWDKVEDKAWEARTMETYAAMVHRMDAGVGRIVEKLKADGKLDNTLIMFMQDNGGCAETIGREQATEYPKPLKPLGPNDLQPKIWPPMQTRDGRPVRTGPGVMAGPEDTYLSYGEGWANVSDTPFRLYKHWSHEGGISTPLIVHWPKGVAADKVNKLVSEPSHLIDVMATVVDAGEAKYPVEYHGNKIVPAAGKSLLPLVQDKAFDRGEPIFFEHESNRAVRDGKWKIVTNGMGPWELYDMEKDRSETNNLAEEQPDRVKKMAAQWDEWAKKNDVLPLGGWEHGEQKDPDSEAEDNAERTTATVLRLKAGEVVADDESPRIDNRPIMVRANIAKWSDSGVVISAGGSRQGFAVYSEAGKPVFGIRRNGVLTKVVAEESAEPDKPVHLMARLYPDGAMSLKVGDHKPVTAKAEGAIPSTPVEGITVGSDTRGAVGEYTAPATFGGEIKSVVVRLDDGKAESHGKKGKAGKAAKGKKAKKKKK